MKWKVKKVPKLEKASVTFIVYIALKDSKDISKHTNASDARMHSSRMHTARSNSHLLGGVSASVHAGIHPPGLGLDTPLCVWAWRPPCPQVWAWIPWVWAWSPPPLARPLNPPQV